MLPALTLALTVLLQQKSSYAVSKCFNPSLFQSQAQFLTGVRELAGAYKQNKCLYRTP